MSRLIWIHKQGWKKWPTTPNGFVWKQGTTKSTNTGEWITHHFASCNLGVDLISEFGRHHKIVCDHNWVRVNQPQLSVNIWTMNYRLVFHQPEHFSDLSMIPHFPVSHRSDDVTRTTSGFTTSHRGARYHPLERDLDRSGDCEVLRSWVQTIAAIWFEIKDGTPYLDMHNHVHICIYIYIIYLYVNVKINANPPVAWSCTNFDPYASCFRTKLSCMKRTPCGI